MVKYTVKYHFLFSKQYEYNIMNLVFPEPIDILLFTLLFIVL